MDLGSSLRRVVPISSYQFALFRLCFGTYLIVHFAHLIPYTAELFSQQGVLPDARLNVTYGILPNPLAVWDTPVFATTFVAALLGLSLLLTLGIWRRAASFLLWYGWACLFNRNNLISNPSLAYVGFMLLACVILPPGEPLRAVRRRPLNHEWVFPGLLFWAAWALLAAGYTFSGLVKLESPSWVDGSALWHVVNNPLARPGISRDLFLAMPLWLIHLKTWFSLAIEILFLPLCFHPKMRMVAWLLAIGLHVGILAVVNFTDLTFGMLMIHFFTFDPRWLPAHTAAPVSRVVLFDGVCGFCDRTIQFLLAEDRAAALRFGPLQGETAAAVRQRHALGDGLESLLYVTGLGGSGERVDSRSTAVLKILNDIGGLWRVVSWLRLIPAPIRDGAYDFIARRRYAWFGRYDTCRMPSPETRARFLP